MLSDNLNDGYMEGPRGPHFRRFGLGNVGCATSAYWLNALTVIHSACPPMQPMIAPAELLTSLAAPDRLSRLPCRAVIPSLGLFVPSFQMSRVSSVSQKRMSPPLN